MVNERNPVILDGDPGNDDEIAWTIAHASGKFDILAVCAAAGNQTVEKTTYNALRVCALIGLNVPVASGCPKPLMTELKIAPSVHGESGLDGPPLPEPVFEPVEGRSVDLMVKVMRSTGNHRIHWADDQHCGTAVSLSGVKKPHRPDKHDGRRVAQRQLDPRRGVQHTGGSRGREDRF